MQHLIRTGKVRYGCVSNHPPELMERAMKIGPVVSSQNQYNPFRRQTQKEIFPFCLKHNVGVLGWGSLSEGILTDDWNLDALDPRDFRQKQFYALSENREKVNMSREVFRSIARARGKKMSDVVVAWELSHQALTGPIIGVGSGSEARDMIEGIDLTFSQGIGDDRRRAKDLGLGRASEPSRIVTLSFDSCSQYSMKNRFRKRLI